MFDAQQLVESIPAGDRLAAALALIEAELDTDPRELCDQLLTERLLTAMAVTERAQAFAMVQAGAWEPRRTWEDGISHNARGWLSATTDISSDDALQVLRCGRLVAGHEMLAKHLRSGELSCRKVEAVARVVTDKRAGLFARDEHILLHHLGRLTGDQAAKVMNQWRALCDDALANDDATKQHERRRFHHSRTGNTFHANGQFDLDDGAIIDAALRDAMGSPDAADRPGGARTPGAAPRGCFDEDLPALAQRSQPGSGHQPRGHGEPACRLRHPHRVLG